MAAQPTSSTYRRRLPAITGPAPRPAAPGPKRTVHALPTYAGGARPHAGFAYLSAWRGAARSLPFAARHVSRVGASARASRGVGAAARTALALRADLVTTRTVPAGGSAVAPRLRSAPAGVRTLRGGPLMSVTTALSWFRGEDVQLNFEMSPPADITGWTLTFTVKDTLGGTTQFTVTPSITDGPRGKFRVAVASGSTAALAVGRYVWDVRRTDAGAKTTVADGTLDLRQEITP